MRAASIFALTFVIALGCSSDDEPSGKTGSGGTAGSDSGGTSGGGTSGGGTSGGGTSGGGTSGGGTSGGGTSGGGTSGGGASGGGASGGGTSGAGGDAGSAPSVAVTLPCADAVSDLYVAPSGLPAFAPSMRGDVVRCVTDDPLAQADVSTRLNALKIPITATNGTKRYRIAYRTERGAGVVGGIAGLGTAIVTLPDPPPRGPLPIIVVTHGTSGLADACAPSKTPDDLDYLILPFAGTGLPVIAPDYAGLGTEGVQGYGDGVDTGQSALDAARALRKLVAQGSLSSDIIVSGHSQGGGAALNAQALASTYGADGTVRAVIPFAPGWQDTPAPAVGIYKYANLVPTNLALGVPAAVAALYAYADQYNGVGPTNPGALFNSNVRADVAQMIEGSCVLAIALALPQKAQTFAELFEPAYLDGVVTCLETNGATCDEPAKGFLARMAAHYRPIDPAGGKILILQGLKDAQATPERTACYVEQMIDTGAPPTVCADAEATHFDVVPRNIAFARSWVDSLLSGTTLPTCSAAGMPTCTQ